MARVADHHGVRLHNTLTNKQYMEEKNKLFPSSPWVPSHYEILESNQPDILEIQNVNQIIDNLDDS